MDSNEQTRDLPAHKIKKEFECDIFYEPIKKEIVEEDTSENDQSNNGDDVFYETIKPGLSKRIQLQNENDDLNICRSEKNIVKNESKLVEHKPCKSQESTNGIPERDTKFIHDKNYNLSCSAENMLTKPNLMSDLCGLDSDLKNALENPTYKIDCDEKEGVLIMKMINDKFSSIKEDGTSYSKDSLMDKVKCKTEIEDDIDIIHKDALDDSGEKKAVVINDVLNETELNSHKNDPTDDVDQGRKRSKEKMSCSSFDTTKESAAVSVFYGDMDTSATVIKQNLSISKEGNKILKVLLYRNFGLRISNQNNRAGLLFYDSSLQFNHLKYAKNSHIERQMFECELCSKLFINRIRMLRHYRNHTKEKPQCAICSKTFYNKLNLLCHIRISHKGELLFQCKLCSHSFTRKSSLVKHEKIHERKNPYHCKLCPKSFFTEKIFKVHLRSHEEKLFKCNLCSNSYRHSSSLAKHTRDHDKNKRKYNCSFCHKSFSRKSNWATHERIHTGEKPYCCKYCPKSFSDKSHLFNHERTHTGERPFLCGVCSKSFNQSSNLRTHEKIHIGERPFKCKRCPMSFIHQYTLLLHQRVHKSEKQKLRDDKYHCKFCSKSFQFKNGLDYHENTHANEEPLRCKFCTRSYCAKSSLTAHERTHQHKKTTKSKV